MHSHLDRLSGTPRIGLVRQREFAHIAAARSFNRSSALLALSVLADSCDGALSRFVRQSRDVHAARHVDPVAACGYCMAAATDAPNDIAARHAIYLGAAARRHQRAPVFISTTSPNAQVAGAGTTCSMRHRSARPWPCCFLARWAPWRNGCATNRQSNLNCSACRQDAHSGFGGGSALPARRRSRPAAFSWRVPASRHVCARHRASRRGLAARASRTWCATRALVYTRLAAKSRRHSVSSASVFMLVASRAPGRLAQLDPESFCRSPAACAAELFGIGARGSRGASAHGGLKNEPKPKHPLSLTTTF